MSDRRRLWLCDDPEATDGAATRPLVRMLRVCGVGFEQLHQSQCHVTAPPTPNEGCVSMSSQKLDVSSTRSWPTRTGSLGRTLNPATGSLHRCWPHRWSR
jgi:hypothetical protein